MRNLPLALLLAGSIFAIGCAPQADEETDDQNGAINADEASKSVEGATKKLIDDRPALTFAKKVGVYSWTVFGVNKRDYQGAVFFGLDRDGDVKVALFAARDGASSDKAKVALVNYDKKGPIAATPDDGKTLEALQVDLFSLQEELAGRKESELGSCLFVSAAVAAGALAGAGLGVLLVATTAPVWVVAGAAVVGLGGQMAFASVVTDTPLKELVFNRSCQATAARR